ncbi:MAG: ABC transporter substrate-binding protein [Cephaloticoccus sp.]|nr:ABC transporter substrate-binding protein [Cephaloticoccus sp.]MCF7760258.1 ABC transporter substrate-binding protein [Cephaloticoccus sp.]
MKLLHSSTLLLVLLPSISMAAEPFKLTVQLDWVAEPEHGGFYQAQAKGYFAAEGLDVTILPGGPNAFVMPKVATGQADIGQADSTNTLLQQAEGLPVLQFGAVFQDDPSGLLVNAESSIRTFTDLEGKTIVARPEWAFLVYLREKLGLHFNIVPTNYAISGFLTGQEIIQQGYYIAEPYHIVKAGAKSPRFLATWDADFRAYAVLVTNRRFARQHPAELNAFLRAYIKGWHDYLESDPTPAHALMKAANPNNTDDFMLASRQLIIDGKLVTGRDAVPGDDAIGRLDPARYARQIAQLEELGILKKGTVTVEQAMTTEFLP